MYGGYSGVMDLSGMTTTSDTELKKIITPISVDDIADVHPIRRFDVFWHMKKNADGVFERRFFGPGTGPQIIPWLVILERPEDGGWRFKYQFCGSGFTQLVGMEMTGTLVGDLIHKGAARAFNESLMDCIESGEPSYSSTNLPVTDREWMSVQRGLFPHLRRRADE